AMDAKRRGARRPSKRALALACAACSCGLLALIWFGSRSFRDRVEAEVRAGVPIGTPRGEARTWLQRTYGFQPRDTDDVTGDQFQGQSVPQLAGIPADELGGLLRVTAARHGLFGSAINAIHRDQVWVYLLIDRQGRVSGYYFLSIDELRAMEIAKQGAR